MELTEPNRECYWYGWGGHDGLDKSYPSACGAKCFHADIDEFFGRANGILNPDCSSCDKFKPKTDIDVQIAEMVGAILPDNPYSTAQQILQLIKDSGYLPPDEVKEEKRKLVERIESISRLEAEEDGTQITRLRVIKDADWQSIKEEL